VDGEHPISHLGPKNLSRTGGPEHYLVYGRPKQIPNLVGKTDHNIGGSFFLSKYSNFHILLNFHTITGIKLKGNWQTAVIQEPKREYGSFEGTVAGWDSGVCIVYA